MMMMMVQQQQQRVTILWLVLLLLVGSIVFENFVAAAWSPPTRRLSQITIQTPWSSSTRHQERNRNRVVLHRNKRDYENNYYYDDEDQHEYAPWTRRTKSKGKNEVTSSPDEYAPWTATNYQDDVVGVVLDDEEPSLQSTTLSYTQQQQQQQQLGGGGGGDQQPLLQTLSGGTAMIFEMARRMLLWEDFSSSMMNPSSTTTTDTTSTRELPRWRPYGGISDANPLFRTRPPAMTSQGYAAAIWRNARKRNKPSLWRHALRLYNRMYQNDNDDNNKPEDETRSNNNLPRMNAHYEGALLACAKLGLWQRALQIFRQVEEEATKRANATAAAAASSSPSYNHRHVNPTVPQRKTKKSATSTTAAVAATTATTTTIIPPDPSITENMILSLIRACVHGSKSLDRNVATIDERRAPLDIVRDILLDNLEQRHGIPLVARHLNPLAAAYQSLGLLNESTQLLQNHLADRILGPESETGVDPLNVHDIGAKDKASYALLVMSAVSSGEWANAIDALRNMTEAGLYPNDGRHVNAWMEVSERKSRQRTTRSWKKKRDEMYWLESIR